ncbi:MAG: hypothetical protein M3Z01_04620 [Thermoproteota archaeon]|nr:hypothetical protein [Thermoproteota archaeon]
MFTADAVVASDSAVRCVDLDYQIIFLIYSIVGYYTIVTIITNSLQIKSHMVKILLKL